VEARRAETADLADELVSQRAASRIGEPVRILVEELESEVTGRAAHQGPEVDGSVRLLGARRPAVGELVHATVVDSEGADLVAEVMASW
jgi:tRNA A37 methylthiotransferase MiaB